MKPINGFTRRLHPYQIGSYILLFLLVFSYFFITFPLSPNVAKVPFTIVGTILEVILGLTAIVSGYLATAIDPSDTFLKESIEARNQNRTYSPEIKEFYCNVDLAFVHESSKHCKRCNRCTEDFDHHCKWINNDVGKKNYKPFFILILSVLLYLIVYIGLAINLTVNFANDSTLLDNDIFLYENDSDQIRGAMIALWVVLGFSVGLLVFDINLVFFHLFLIKKGLTTFQYIVAIEERKDYQREMELTRKILGEKPRTCLDFVLCIKKKKKNQNHNQKSDNSSSRPDVEGKPPNNTPTKDAHYPEYEEIKRKLPEVEKSIKISSNGANCMREIKVQENINNIDAKDKHESTNGKDNEVYYVLSRNLEAEDTKGTEDYIRRRHERSDYGSMPHFERTEATEKQEVRPLSFRKELIEAKELQVMKKTNTEREGNVKAIISQTPSVNEFGDITVLNNSKNREALNKSLHFESLKTLEDRKGLESQAESLQILEDNYPVNDKEIKGPVSHHQDENPVIFQAIEIETGNMKNDLNNRTKDLDVAIIKESILTNYRASYVN